MIRTEGDIMADGDNGWRGATEARLSECERRLGVVETHPFVCPQIKVVVDHEDRIRKLEAMRWQIAGVVAVVQAVGVTVILAAIKGWLK
jgi:hypothetical protein